MITKEQGIELSPPWWMVWRCKFQKGWVMTFMDMRLEGLSDKGNLLVCRNFFSHNGYFLVLA